MSPVPRPEEDAAVRALALGAATIGESGGRPMMPRIRPAWPGARVAGPAFTVRCGTGDNLAIHVAVTAAAPGTVLVVDAHEEPDLGYWGEVLTTGAMARGIAGLVIDGGVRDVAALEGHRFPVFAAGIALPGATKAGGGAIGGTVSVGGVEVATRDWVVADRDGVTAIPAAAFARTMEEGEARALRELELFSRLRDGATTVDLLGLDPGAVERDAD